MAIVGCLLDAVGNNVVPMIYSSLLSVMFRITLVSISCLVYPIVPFFPYDDFHSKKTFT